MFARGVHVVKLRGDAIGGVDVGTHNVFVGGMKLRIGIYVWLHYLDGLGFQPHSAYDGVARKVREKAARGNRFGDHIPQDQP